jgi:hypothetical protein
MIRLLIILLAALTLGFTPWDQVKFDDTVASYSSGWSYHECQGCNAWAWTWHKTKVPGAAFHFQMVPGLNTVEIHYLSASIGSQIKCKLDGVWQSQITLNSSLQFSYVMAASATPHRVRCKLVSGNFTLDWWRQF